LLRTGNGVLYGVTTKSDSAGVVYALTPSGGSYVQTVLHVAKAHASGRS
jgi:hypothetical protein